MIPLLQDHGKHSKLIDHSVGSWFDASIVWYVVKTPIQLLYFTMLMNVDSFVNVHCAVL